MARVVYLKLLLGFVLIGVVLGDVHATSERRMVSSFQNIEISGGGNLWISQGEEESLLIETDAELLGYIKTVVANGTLSIYPDRDIRPVQGLVYRLVVKDLKKISSLSGAMDIKGNLRLDQLVLDASGGSTIKFTLDSDKVESSISGGSRLDLSGGSKHHIISLSGASKFSGFNFCTKKSNMQLSGASEGETYVTDDLSLSLSGASRVTYRGNPVHFTKSVTGSSQISSEDGLTVTKDTSDQVPIILFVVVIIGLLLFRFYRN